MDRISFADFNQQQPPNVYMGTEPSLGMTSPKTGLQFRCRVLSGLGRLGPRCRPTRYGYNAILGPPAESAEVSMAYSWS